jgi:hypothetical protein
MSAGNYLKFVCIRDCSAGYMNPNTRKPYCFTEGNIYGYYFTPQYPLQKNSVYQEDSSYSQITCGSHLGMATSKFIQENFVPEKEYSKDFKELSSLFEKFMTI